MLDAGVANAQLDARDRPNVSGPLVHTAGSCDTGRPRAGGQVAVVLRACSDVYTFKAGKETDPNRNYDVIWLQTTVEPRNGYCATDATSTLTVPKGSRIERKAPRKKRTDERIRYQTRLVAKAGGTAVNNGVVKQGFALYPRIMDPTLEGRTLTLEWRGRTSKTVAFALGVEVSYPENDPPANQPQGTVRSTLRPC
jgi:hypothetical protein